MSGPAFDPYFLAPLDPGNDVRRYLALPDSGAPRLLVDVSSPREAARAVLQRADIYGPRDIARYARLAAAVAARRQPAGAPVVEIRGGGDTTPAMLRRLETEGIGRAAWWSVSVTPGKVRRRGVFFVRLEDGRRIVVKFGLTRGQSAKFDREEAGLALAAAAGGVVAAHAPRSLGRFQLDDYSLSVQTSAPGQDLGHVLRGPLPRVVKVRLLERVVAWTISVARSTGTDAGAVFTHGDLADGNVVVAPRSMSVVDWERARANGAPLWDLLYFSVTALPLLDGVAGLHENLSHLLGLFRGEERSSGLLFGWIRRYARALDLPGEKVGELTAACWRDHAAFQDTVVADERRELTGTGESEWPLMARFAEAWARDPLLGESWRAWR